MAYWVMKSRPDDGGIDFLRPGKRSRWRTTKPPKGWRTGDRLFFWIASPHKKLVGLGQIDGDPDTRPFRDESWFPVRYRTGTLPRPLAIDRLRQCSTLNGATFLKSGPSGTLFPLTDEQGEFLYRMVVADNPEAASVWPDVPMAAGDDALVDLDLSGVSGKEGRQRLVAHLRRERNRALVERKKTEMRMRDGQLRCEACGLQFGDLHRRLGEACCEVHHGSPLGDVTREVTTSLDDLHVLCSNCHRMIHRTTPLMTVQEFRTFLTRGS